MYIATPSGWLGLRGAAARRSATWPFALVGLRATSHTCDSLYAIAHSCCSHVISCNACASAESIVVMISPRPHRQAVAPFMEHVKVLSIEKEDSMPSYVNMFKSPAFIEEEIVDAQTGKKIGTIRVKPVAILWKPANKQDFHSVSLNDFVAWITSAAATSKKLTNQ